MHKAHTWPNELFARTKAAIVRITTRNNIIIPDRDVPILADSTLRFQKRNPTADMAVLTNYILRSAKTMEVSRAEEAFTVKTAKMLHEPKLKISYADQSEISTIVKSGFDPDMSAVVNLPNLITKTTQLLLDSRFRNINADRRSSRFTMKFTSRNTAERITQFYPGVVRMDPSLTKQVIELKLVSATIPNIVSPAFSSVDLPYVLINVDETRPNELMSSLTSHIDFFGIIQFDMNKDDNVTFRKMTNTSKVCRGWTTKQPITLPQLTVSLYDPNGNELNFDTDILTIAAFDVGDTNYVTTVGSGYITKTISLTTAEPIDPSLSGESITFYDFKTQQAFEDIGTAGVFYYTEETLVNSINAHNFKIQVTGPNTFDIEFVEGARSNSVFPDDNSIQVETYGIGKGSGGYATINSRQVSFVFELTGLV